MTTPNPTTETVVPSKPLEASPPNPFAQLSRAAHATPIPWQVVEWTEERLKLLRTAIAPPTATPAEVDFFVEWCRQTGLNPFLKQAFLVERRQKDPRDDEKWISKHDPLVAESGFAARADAIEDFGGMRSGVVYEGDEFAVDESEPDPDKAVIHRWDLATRQANKMKILGAWAHGRRHGRVVEVTYVSFDSRAQKFFDRKNKVWKLTQFWERDGAGMIRKCARADQYRRLYPNIFGGWIAEEEGHLSAEEREITDDAPATPLHRAPSAKSSALKDRLKKPQTVEGQKVTKPAPTPAPTPTPGDAPAPKSTPPKTPPKNEGGVLPLDLVRFGPHRGKSIENCTTLELEESLAVATEELKKSTGKEPWVAPTLEGVKAIETEITARESNEDPPPPADEDAPF